CPPRLGTGTDLAATVRLPPNRPLHTPAPLSLYALMYPSLLFLKHQSHFDLAAIGSSTANLQDQFAVNGHTPNDADPPSGFACSQDLHRPVIHALRGLGPRTVRSQRRHPARVSPKSLLRVTSAAMWCAHLNNSDKSSPESRRTS